MLLSANELGFKPKMMGGAMVGLQATVFKDKLKAKLNGVVNYETWVPSPKLMAPAADFFKKYQDARQGRRRRSARLLSRRLGLCLSAGAGRRRHRLKEHQRRQDRRLPARPRVQYHHGAGIKFGKNGEWTKSGMMQVQYHDLTDAANLDTWRGMSYQTVLTPADEKTGGVIYPYAKALK